MRYLSRVLLLVFTLLSVSFFMSPSISSAEDVWIMSRDGFDHYMITDTIKKGARGYQVNVKIVYNGKYDNFRILSFDSVNDLYMIMEEFTRYDGKWTVSSDDELGEPLWNAMKPYMKAKGISYPDLGYK